MKKKLSKKLPPLPKNYLFLTIGFIFLTFLFIWTRTTYKPIGTIKVYDRNGVLLYEETKEYGRNRPVPLREMPKNLQNAAISIEDKSFWKNPGFDLAAIVRAVNQNVQEGQIITGASTITQQLVRLKIFDDSYKTRQSYIRKVREITTAARLTFSKPKTQILEDYLNTVYFGNRNYGVEAAANIYFDKKAVNLSLAESAFLAALISSPEKYDPYNFFDPAKQRQEYVLDLMTENDFISTEKAEEAKKEPIVLSESYDISYALHFVNYVIEKAKTLDLKEPGGIKVHTTLDVQKYLIAKDIATTQVNKLAQRHDLTNASLILLDNKTGEILVMLGGINYYDQENGGNINMTTALRQPGSAMKPITYALGFKQGYTPAFLIEDVEKIYMTKDGESYIPKNYDNMFRGNITIREALASSLNMPAVELLSRVGLDNFLNQAQKMGVTSLKRADEYDLAITLGGGEIKLVELTNMFATFARGGEYLPFYSVSKITDDYEKILFEHAVEKPVQTLGDNGDQISYLITSILSDPQARMMGFGEKNLLVLSQPAAAKTGTTSDWHDVWTLGYTPDYTVGVWVGNNDNTPMREITGLTGAAPVWNQFFEKILANESNVAISKNFIKPKGIVSKWVCKNTGLLDNGVCAEKYEELFIEGTAPIRVSPVENEAGNGSDNKVAEKPFLNILSPRPKAEYELAPELVSDETIVFEAQTSADIAKIGWSLNGDALGFSETKPFTYLWKPETGQHNLTAVGYNNQNNPITSGKTNFKVVLFKQYDAQNNRTP